MRIRYHLSRFFLFKGKRTNLWFFVSNACLCTSRTHPKERVSEAVTARSPGSCWVCLHGGWLAAFLPPGRVGPPGQAVSGFDRKRPRVREIYLCIYKRTRFAFSIWVLQYAVLHTTCEKSKKLAYMFHWPPDTRETLTSLATTTPSRDEPMAWTCFEHAQILYTDTHVSQAMSLVYLFSPLYFSFFSIFSFFPFWKLFWQIRESVRKSRVQPTQHPWPLFTLQAHGRRRSLRHRGRGGRSDVIGEASGRSRNT